MTQRMFEIIRWAFMKLNNGRGIKSRGIPKLKRGVEIKSKGSSIYLGKSFNAQTNTHFVAVNGGDLMIGDHVSFNRNCIVICRGAITIGDRCTFGPNVCIYDHNHKFDLEGVKGLLKAGEIVIGKSYWISAGVIILKDTHIGDGCVIGAGAVVKGVIPEHSVVTSDRTLKITPIKERP